jgi:dynein regulatory complex protein 1
LRHDYGFQLNSIEDEFERERSELLKHNLEDVEALFKKHKETEKKFSEDKMKKQQEYAEKIELLRSTDANVNSEQKIKLEKEMQTLEKCMEDMKAIFKLNNEKLVFNFRVLKEREIVNKS